MSKEKYNSTELGTYCKRAYMNGMQEVLNNPKKYGLKRIAE